MLYNYYTKNVIYDINYLNTKTATSVKYYSPYNYCKQLSICLLFNDLASYILDLMQ